MTQSALDTLQYCNYLEENGFEQKQARALVKVQCDIGIAMEQKLITKNILREELDKSTQRLNQRMDSLDKRIDGLDRKIDMVDKKIDMVDSKLTRRIDSVESNLLQEILRTKLWVLTTVGASAGIIIASIRFLQ